MLHKIYSSIATAMKAMNSFDIDFFSCTKSKKGCGGWKEKLHNSTSKDKNENSLRQVNKDLKKQKQRKRKTLLQLSSVGHRNCIRNEKWWEARKIDKKKTENEEEGKRYRSQYAACSWEDWQRLFCIPP